MFVLFYFEELYSAEIREIISDKQEVRFQSTVFCPLKCRNGIKSG